MPEELPNYKALLSKPSSALSQPPLFEKKGDLFVPSDLAKGPWFSGVQHGGAIVALLTRAMESITNPQEMRIASLHIEMFRKVPLEPVQVKAKVVRDGRRIGALEALMLDKSGELELARGQALRIRLADDVVSKKQVPPPFPEDLEPEYKGKLTKMDFEEDESSYPGSFDAWLDDRDFTGGKGSSWWRMNHPLVDDEALSSLVRIGATADLIMSANGVLGRDKDYISVNPNLFISMQRDLVGEWICLESTVRIDEMGSGETDAVLYDESGRFGRANKSLLIDKRG